MSVKTGQAHTPRGVVQAAVDEVRLIGDSEAGEPLNSPVERACRLPRLGNVDEKLLHPCLVDGEEVRVLAADKASCVKSFQEEAHS